MTTVDIHCGACEYPVLRVTIHRDTQVDFKCQNCGELGSADLVDNGAGPGYASRLPEAKPQ
jgi:hypothetical protein